MQRILSQIGRTPRLTALNLIKRNADGMSVKDLCRVMDMSYMGVKQICLDLERDGYLDTFRRHHGVGRPEILYRLTDKAQQLYPQADNTLAISLLEHARKLYGPGAPGKLLFLHFQQITDDARAAVRGETLAEKTASLARLRDQQGYMAECPASDPLRIVEHHHPMKALLQQFPEIAALEREMFQRLLGAPVRCEELADSSRVFFVG